MRKFLELVPRGVKVIAPVVMVAIMLMGSLAGYFVIWGQHELVHLPMAVCVALGTLGGLAMGAFMAAWVLCLGYVYADAGRREMRPVLWTLIAALFPHLFGFLLYFALRQPLGPRCAGCGQPILVSQRFCSWCGTPRMASGPGGGAAGGAGGVGGMGQVPTA